MWEFYKYFDGLAQVIYWHRGRCPSYGEGVTYWALADMVRMRCRISEDEPSDVVLAKLAGVLDGHVTDADERAFVEPRVAHLLGVEGGGRFEREDLFSAWRLFFERLADVYPTVLAFEDMQWADASLLDFIEHLLEWSRNSPLYVITAARPELVDERPTWGAGKRNFTSLYLEPLRRAAMRALLDGLVAGLPEGLAAQILARSEGVPLYAVETVRMLLDRGHVVQQGSVYRATGPVETLEVPETLHALIAARLDGLSADERLRRPERRRARKDVHEACARGRRRHGRVGLRRDPGGARAQGGAVDPGRPALARARPVRLPAGSDAPGRLRDALAAASGGCATWPPPRTSRPPPAMTTSWSRCWRRTIWTRSRRRPTPKTPTTCAIART